MELIENFGEYQNYWETNRFWNEDLNYSWAIENLQSDLGCYGSSSRDGTASSTMASKNIVSESYDSSSLDGTVSSPIASKNIVSERNRRKKLGDKLLALREAVPKISKLNKASIVKDAIEYIQDLQEQERRLQTEIMELQSKRLNKDPGFDFGQQPPVLLRSKKTKYDLIYDHMAARSCPVEVHELRVTSMGEKILFVSLTCSKTTNTMIRILEVFETLKLKIITANVTTLSGMVKQTVLIEADEEEREPLKKKIERAVLALTSTYSPMQV